MFPCSPLLGIYSPNFEPSRAFFGYALDQWLDRSFEWKLIGSELKIFSSYLVLITTTNWLVVKTNKKYSFIALRLFHPPGGIKIYKSEPLTDRSPRTSWWDWIWIDGSPWITGTFWGRGSRPNRENLPVPREYATKTVGVVGIIIMKYLVGVPFFIGIL